MSTVFTNALFLQLLIHIYHLSLIVCLLCIFFFPSLLTNSQFRVFSLSLHEVNLDDYTLQPLALTNSDAFPALTQTERFTGLRHPMRQVSHLAPQLLYKDRY